MFVMIFVFVSISHLDIWSRVRSIRLKRKVIIVIKCQICIEFENFESTNIVVVDEVQLNANYKISKNIKQILYFP